MKMLNMLLAVVLSLFPLFVNGALDKKLSEPCSTDGDCAIAYSYCGSNKKCVCLKDFYEKGGLCHSNSSICPYWEKPNPNTNSKSCTAYRDEKTQAYVNTCNELTEYCYVHPYVKTEDGKDVGTCCPNPPADARLKMACVVGTAHPNGTCPDTSGVPADAPAPPEKIRTCPYNGYECAWRGKIAACCPRPCRGQSSYFSVKGLCYDYVLINETCTYQVQCGGRSQCLPDGNSGRKTCQCPKGIIPHSAPQYCVE